MSPLQVGDQVIFRSRARVVRGFTPAGVMPAVVFLEDAETEELELAPLAEVLLVFPDESAPEPGSE